MKHEILEANCALLKQRFSNTLEGINDCTTETSGTLEKNGTYHFILEGKPQHPYGETNAQSLIEAWVQTIPKSENTLYLVSGFGTGQHVAQLLDKIDACSVVVVIDFDIPRLKWIFSQKDCSDILNNKQMLLLTCDKDFDLLETLDLVYKTNIQTCIFSPLFSQNEALYYSFFTRLCRQFDMRKKLQCTLVGDSNIWQHNAIKNLFTLLNSPSLDPLKGAFKDLPLVLVSAGPSLDTAIPFLKQVQNKAIIVSMNSSFRTLFKNGIHSHFTLAIDPRPSTFDGFRDIPIGSTVLLTSFFVHPDVVQHFSGQIMTWEVIQPFSQYVYKALHRSMGPQLQGEGTVANLVGSLADFFGCKKVCLVGQDLACVASGQTHTSDSIYNDRGTLFMDVNDCRECPGNTQEKVFVESKLYLYLQIFNKMADKFKNIEFINTSHLGAKIKDIPYVDYEKAAVWIGNNSSEMVSKHLFQLLKETPGTTEEQILEVLKPLARYVQQLGKLTLEAASWHEMHSEPQQDHLRIVRESYQLADKVNAFLDSDLKLYDILFNGKLMNVLFQYQNNLQKLTNESMSAAQANWIKNREYYWALFTGCHDCLAGLLSTFPELSKMLPN